MWRILRRRFSREYSSKLAKTNPLIHENNEFDLYKGSVGVEFEHVSSQEQDWLYSRYEELMLHPLSPSQKLNTFRLLQMAESFESFCQKKFSTYKRYSGEGIESLVPALYSIFQTYKTESDSWVVLNIAHRGKLAVLVSLMGYPMRNLFYKIKGNSLMPPELNKDYYYFVDDISTHIAVTHMRSELKPLRVSMLHNPSHLEVGGAVSMGKTRSKQDGGFKAMNVSVHGDASLGGQGVVYELAQMSHLPDFQVGGSLHLVANNQLGFTTPENLGRSTPYCTDVFKIIGAPVVHVNAMCPEEAVKVCQLAVEYRNKFNKDFAVDLVGYRKYGHNEVDEPGITNPKMYQIIRKMEGCTQSYARKLKEEGILSENVYQKTKSQLEEALNTEFSNANFENLEKDQRGWLKIDSFREQWKSMSPLHSNKVIQTGREIDHLKSIAEASVKVPSNLKLHPILQKGHISNRLKNLEKNLVDWSTAEAMAVGSLLEEGFNVRICGEDSIRGTFTHRNAGFFCQETEEVYFPLKQLGNFSVVNSLLSELGVLGFEYGYSLDNPKNLVMWEAQFGDFSNMGQGIMDQFISSGESKWLRQSGMVLLLPHGQEGMGPDHSSARIERALEAVNDFEAQQVNLEVVNNVIPANYFHLLRRQVLRDFRRPLVIATPKSGLRHKLAISQIEELGPGTYFKPAILNTLGSGSKKLLVCSGKVYLEILNSNKDLSVLLLEQLAPFPKDYLSELLGSRNFEEVVWVQEEPQGQGAMNFVVPLLSKFFDKEVQVISKPPLSAASEGNKCDFDNHMKDLHEKISKSLGN